jgi:uncharacterized membrane protein
MKAKKNEAKKDKAKLLVMLVVSLIVISTGILFWFTSFRKGNVPGGILGIIIVIAVVAFAVFLLKRRLIDMKEGYPSEDERSRRVMEKATSRAFYASLYLLLLVGLLSDSIIKFRDVSQATSAIVGGMAILFVAFWAYYNKKEI